MCLCSWEWWLRMFPCLQRTWLMSTTSSRYLLIHLSTSSFPASIKWSSSPHFPTLWLLTPPDGALHQSVLGWQQLCGGGGGSGVAPRWIWLLLHWEAVPAGQAPVQEPVRAAGAVARGLKPACWHAGEPHLHAVGPGTQEPGHLQRVCWLAG